MVKSKQAAQVISSTDGVQILFCAVECGVVKNTGSRDGTVYYSRIYPLQRATTAAVAAFVPRWWPNLFSSRVMVDIV